MHIHIYIYIVYVYNAVYVYTYNTLLLYCNHCCVISVVILYSICIFLTTMPGHEFANHTIILYTSIQLNN